MTTTTNIAAEFRENRKTSKSHHSKTKIHFLSAKWLMSIQVMLHHPVISSQSESVKKKRTNGNSTNKYKRGWEGVEEAAWSPGGGEWQRPLQIPQVYYSRKASRRDGGGQDVTGSGIDWLRRKIGESDRIDALGAWTEWTDGGGGGGGGGGAMITAPLGLLSLCWNRSSKLC